MPPKAKLHNKSGKNKNIPKPRPVSTPQPSTSADVQNTEDNDNKFAVELLWCIHQLENSLDNKNINPKQAEESMKVLKVLRNNGQPLIRKRQLMRQHFGDYRSKMAAEEKRAKKAENKISISTVSPSTSKSTFIRKSASLAMGDNSFRFNFSTLQCKNESDDKTMEVQTQDNQVTNENVNGSNSQQNCLTNGVKKLDFGSEGFKFNFDVSERS